MFAKPLPMHPVLKLGFLTPYNPYDRMSFSGTSWFTSQALKRQANIDMRILGPHVSPGRFDRLLRRKPTPINADTLDLDGLDAVVGLVASPLLERLSQTHPQLPLFHITDATPAFLREAYGWAVPSAADTTETQLVAKAAATIYSSSAMAQRAPQDLGLPGLQTDAIPFGVNLDELPKHCPQKPPLSVLKLLFVGIDWVRKGGDVAVEILELLNAAGHRAELTVVGRCPEKYHAHPHIVHAGFLNKSKAKSREQMNALYRDAHLLLVPSRGDCTPMVIPEAMAHGTPVLATDTGGIAEQIGGAGAGRTLAPFASPDEWIKAILEMTCDQDSYALASDAAIDRCQAVFSWDHWATTLTTLVREKLSTHSAVPRKIA